MRNSKALPTTGALNRQELEQGINGIDVIQLHKLAFLQPNYSYDE